MKKITTLIVCLVLSAYSWGQMTSPTAGNAKTLVRSLKGENQLPFDLSLKPFYHGVASGDPLHDRVIIWTRVTSDMDMDPIKVKWFMADKPDMSHIVKSGEVMTSAARDYTVKVDVMGLKAGTTYYYAFATDEGTSLVGRTRTTPSENVDQLRFGVVSCSNYQAGYFNAYNHLSKRRDLDAIIHLGDYIYEYGSGAGTYGFDSSRLDRSNVPDHEILTLADYRTRYSLYRLDKNLRMAHQQHPFISIWDDHEFTNDAYVDGAENHTDSTEGDWNVRKAISKQVYFEWMPIRDNQDSTVYRTIRYGKLADLIMIDTRIEGRDKQINDVTNPLLYAPTRTLLGPKQKGWLFNELKSSNAKWKIVANQVIFSEFHVGWAANSQAGQTPQSLESDFLDIWDGYPFERNQIIDSIAMNQISNVVILTGDFHSSFAYDVAKFPSPFSLSDPLYDSMTYNGLPGYNPTNGQGSFAVEFATPSITSANFDENLALFAQASGLPKEQAKVVGAQQSAGFEFQINHPFADTIPVVGGLIPNPHMKYADLDQHGYFILDVNDGKTQADYFYTDILSPALKDEAFGAGFFTSDSDNHLTIANQASVGKETSPDLAPALKLVQPKVLVYDTMVVTDTMKVIETVMVTDTMVVTDTMKFTKTIYDTIKVEVCTPSVTNIGDNVAVFGFYPNPAKAGAVSYLNFGLLNQENVEIKLLDVSGSEVYTYENRDFKKGNHTLTLDIPLDMKTGIYMLRLKSSTAEVNRKLVITE